MTKDGFGVIITVILFSIILTIGTCVTENNVLIIITIISWVMVGFSFYFFRDPNRAIPSEENLILSPADGKVIAIEEEYEPLFFKSNVTKISIFLSIFDVHINRIPIGGKVTYFDYLKGKFHQAFRPSASTENEQTIIGIENDNCKLLFKKIAGIIARRIVCRVREGSVVKKGHRFGMIKFGSRVDIFIPEYAHPQVKLNDRVKGGETIIGLVNEK